MKKIKKLLSLLTIVTILLSCSLVTFAFEGDAFVNVTSNLPTTVSAGDTVTFSIYAEKTDGSDVVLDGGWYIAGVGLYYPSDVITFSSKSNGGYNGLFSSFDTRTEAGETMIYASGEKEEDGLTYTINGDTALLTFSFDVPASATAGTVYTFKVNPSFFGIEDTFNAGFIKLNAETTFSTTVAGAEPDPVVKDATVAEITEEGWVWTDAKAYKVSTTVEGDVSEVSCALKVSYTRNSDSAVITDKVLDSINLAGIYATEGSTISFKPIFKGTDAITGLRVKGTFTLK